MEINRFKPVPFNEVLNFAPFFENNNPDRKLSIEDLLFATLFNEPLKQAVKSQNWKLRKIRIVCTKDIRCFLFFNGVSHVKCILLTTAYNEPFNSAHTVEIGSAWSHFLNQYDRRNHRTGGFEKDVLDNGNIENFMSKWNYRKIEIPNVRIRKFLCHFMEMLHMQCIDLEIRSMQFDINSLKGILSGININSLTVDPDGVGRDYYYHSVLRTFLPKTNLEIVHTEEVPKDVLVLYFDKLVINNYFSWTLNNLLIMDSKLISLRFLKPEEQLLNRFIKLWQKGSHDKLEVLKIDVRGFNGLWDVAAVMKGIYYQEYSGNHRPERWEELPESQRLLDIRSSGGKKATVQLCDTYGSHFVMYVNNPTYTDERGVEHEYLGETVLYL